ncbi:hypothetical protein [Halorussus litoreus]|uniref:hypothetical protein n=1 Tax=Halorussus litoreus TaxID=1710536 RepID=UPI000E260407|nr:hypothetical protein [Halorussus litoreus]
MVPSPDPGDRGATGEERPDEQRAARKAEQKEDEEKTRPEPEVRWVQIREPRLAVEIGRNGRILASRFHEDYDAWEVLLETYEGEPSE